MKMTAELKAQIAAHIKQQFEDKKGTYSSQNKFADTLQLNKGTLSNIISGKYIENQQLISDAKWVEVANKTLFIFKKADDRLITAETEIFKKITMQLDFARQYAECFVICDDSGIGKTKAIEEYAKQDYVYLISERAEVGSRTRFINELASVTGGGLRGSIIERYDKAVEVLLKNALEQPILIIDEAGDLSSDTYLLIKKLYNRTKGKLAIVLVGADGLEKKIERGVSNNTNGFAEMYSRFGARYIKYIPNEPKQKREFLELQVIQICKANGIEDLKVLERICSLHGDMRRVEREIKKHRKQSA